MGHVTHSLVGFLLDLLSGNSSACKIVSASRGESGKKRRIDMTSITYNTEKRTCRWEWCVGGVYLADSVSTSDTTQVEDPSNETD